MPATREPAEAPAETPRTLRGRVVDSDGAPLEGREASLSFLGDSLAQAQSDAAGRFEFLGPLTPGTVLEVAGEYLERIEPESIELDALPEDELVFVAHAEPKPPAGLVHGVVVDELDGSPVPYAELTVDGLRVEADGEGRFVGAEPMEIGTLDIHVHPTLWSFEIAFDPGQAEPILVPARLGPTIYFEIDGAAQDLHVQWLPYTQGTTPPGFPLGGGVCQVRRAQPAFVRLPRHERNRAVSGWITLTSGPFRAAQARFGPGLGTRDAPLQLSLHPCARLGLELGYEGRRPEWYEEVSVVLRPQRGGAGVRLEGASEFSSFAIFEPGPYVLEALLDDRQLGEHVVLLELGQQQIVRLLARLPEHEAETSEVELVPVAGRVTSERNGPTPGKVRLTRASDGAEELLTLEWQKEKGRWYARFSGMAPAGEVRVGLELEPDYAYVGPRLVTLPSEAELLFSLDDDVPLVNVYLEPRAAEDGRALPAFEATLELDHGNMWEGEDFGSPSLPVLVGHPCNVPFTWLAVAAGRRAASGRYEPRDEGGEVRIPFSLERGWGAILYVGDAHANPLEGVEVRLDGIVAGATGSHGFLALGSPARPGSLTLHYRNWQLEDGDVNVEGTFDDSELTLSAYLRPPAR